MTKPQEVVESNFDEDIDAQHATMKKKHSNIEYVIEVEGKFAYLRRIDRGTLEVALGKLQKMGGDAEYVLAGEIILTSCWVAGDDIIKEDPDLLVAAALQCNALIETKSATLKKI